MEKYGTYDEFENVESGEIKKISLHEQRDEDLKEELLKTGSKKKWKKVTNKKKDNKNERQNS